MTRAYKKYLAEREKVEENFKKTVGHLIGKEVSLRELHILFPRYKFTWWSDDSGYGCSSFYIADDLEAEKERIESLKKDGSYLGVHKYDENDPYFDKKFIVDNVYRIEKRINLSSPN